MPSGYDVAFDGFGAKSSWSVVVLKRTLSRIGRAGKERDRKRKNKKQ